MTIEKIKLKKIKIIKRTFVFFFFQVLRISQWPLTSGMASLHRIAANRQVQNHDAKR